MKNKIHVKRIVAIIVSLIFIACSMIGCGAKSNTSSEDNIKDKDWSYIVNKAKGTTVTFYGWGGNEQTNEWIDNYLAKQLKDNYNITLKRVPMDIDDILNKMLGEKQANSKKGNIDVVWINGENFYNAKKNNLLYGPFTDRLPNYQKYVDKNSKDIKYDFGFPIEGYEAPFGKSQFVMVYNSSKVNNVPTDYKQLLSFVKSNPGEFTYPAPPDFTGSAFVRNIIYEIVGYQKLMNIKPDKEVVQKEIQPALNYLKELKPYLWNEGKTYPSTSTMLDNMYSDGQVVDTMTYNPNAVVQKVSNGEFPKESKTTIFKNGTIGNTHFLAIPFNSPNKAAAMVVINSVLSFESQYSKYNPQVWGDLPVFDNNKLSNKQKQQLKNIHIGGNILTQDELLKHRLPELPANLVPVIEKIWQENIPQGK